MILEWKLELEFVMRTYWQEAHLSQRGRARLHLVEHFAKSLMVMHGHLKLHCSVE